MKIGVVHFGWASAGTAQIVRTLIEGLTAQGKSVFGVEYNRDSNKIELNDIKSKRSSNRLSSEDNIFLSFPLNVWNEKADEIAKKVEELDKLIILGGQEIKTIPFSVKHLYVPVSIYNNMKGNEFTLGYDTAMNSIVTCVESVRDTASSLLYGKVRVFNVQIPGTEPSGLLTNSALAVDAAVVGDATEDSIQLLQEHIRNKEANKETYTFFMMNQSIDPNELAVHFKEFDLDWKVVEIDESQCGGPFPTAQDRLLANLLKNAIFKWSSSNEPSGQLLIHKNQALFEAAEVKVN
ncbi:6-phosphofructokinase [Metabacillus malikii]|uniref:6-phosphofructokinase 1 n=1 Tax=Metabacillus malikii TaxID=1504265 RepID=A0ABT9ZBI2_9BACI|nr:6-phosphofructokinase [Metabacillus malikii]MDQ0229631.1 6-phosphofructokinase 1 [Metabacillus malikii]